MPAEIKDRFKRLLLPTGGLLVAGLLYLAFYGVTGWGIPCIFHLVTGLYCPGCGITRMCVALLHFDLIGAFQSNLGVMLCLPFGLLLVGWQIVGYLRTGKHTLRKGQNVLLWGMVVFLLVFAVLRNLLSFGFLRPV